MDLSQYMPMLVQGFGRNFLIVLLSMIVPLGLGILFTMLACKKRNIEKVFSWVSLPFECICPAALMVALYFGVFSFVHNALLPIVVAFSIAFIGYMPARINRSMSAGRNIAYNALGLFGALYKWSFCVHIVAYQDLFAVANIIRSRTYRMEIMLVPLLVSFGILAVIEVLRRIIKNGAK